MPKRERKEPGYSVAKLKRLNAAMRPPTSGFGKGRGPAKPFSEFHSKAVNEKTLQHEHRRKNSESQRLLEKMKEWVLKNADIKVHFQNLKAAAEHIVKLIVIFVLQSLVISLLLPLGHGSPFHSQCSRSRALKSPRGVITLRLSG
jgi:hypothetical protein